MNQDSKHKMAAATVSSNGESAGFSWKLFFSEVFVSRKGDVIEERLSWGFPGRVPSLEDVSTEMPRPWLFARCLLFGLLGCLILWYALNKTEEVNFVPAFMMFGCFAVPCSVMVLFYETNIFRDVSFVRTGGGFLAGAVMSLCLTIPLTWLADRLGLPSEAWVAGPVEEPAKLIAALFLLRFVKRKTVFCGLLVGSAVGAGFAAFESAGYALRAAFQGAFIGVGSQMRDLTLFGYTNQTGVVPIIDLVTNIVLWRGILSPFTHVVWTALTTAAICRATGGRRLTWKACRDPRFLGVFALVVGLHMFWNSPVTFENPWLKLSILGLVAWLAVGATLNNGLRQAKAMKLALAAGDRGFDLGASKSARVDAEAPLWYSRGGEVHGPLKITQISEMVDTGIFEKSVLVSDGSDWHPYLWWMGENSESVDGSREPTELWAWALVWWPVVIAGLVYFLRSPWPVTGFPVVLVLLALLDRSSNKRGKNQIWPTSLAALIPPVYLFMRTKCTKDGGVKFVAGTLVTGLVLALVLIGAWQVYGTEEGKVVRLVNKQFEAKNVGVECLEADFERRVSSSVKTYSVKLSNGERRKVTLLSSAGGMKVTVEGMQD